ncbi:hypothetical protein [Ruegeria sp. HKCCD6428]|uniref:hypothetical protein n=1 Tax=Ruegeria sp. HKCCD6428 TaxID=2683002 RepID=UPI0014909A38|nr:hypothetical protein [Ruegeria sp. HKCCD6428]NOC85914.1 hypothetical protein [Ruegeria sp. HKCCD6428]
MSANADSGLKDNRDVTDTEGDYSVYPHMDGIKSSMSWKLGSYGERGALSDDMIESLAERFDLPFKLVRELSVLLGNCLNNDDDIAINLTEVRRSQAIERGQKYLKQLLRKAKQSSIGPQELRNALGSLSTYFASTPEDADLLPQVLDKLETATALTQDVINDIRRIHGTPGAIAEMSPRDKRFSRDKRRQYIVESCCYIWKDAGRPLTYTTYSDGRPGGQRQGPLVNFIQAVVKMITEPGQILSGETIRVDIDGFRDKLEREEQERWAPPELGNQYT